MAGHVVRAIVAGRVQGVSFRAWTRDAARGLDLRGWVRNRADGTVEAVIGGSEDAVARMCDRLWQGPGPARVTGVDIRDADEVLPAGFEIRR